MSRRPLRCAPAAQLSVLFAASSAVLLHSLPARAQVATGWKGTGANNNWNTAANWDNTPPATARDLFFGAGWLAAGGTGTTTSNNDLTNYHGHKIFFENVVGAPNFTITGNSLTLFDFGGATPVFPQINNSSGATQTVSLDVAFNDTSGTNKCEVNPVNGNLVFNGTIDLAGANTQLQVFGNNQKTVTFNAPITSTGNAGGNSFALNQNSNAVIKAACTYLGQTFVNAGHLQFDVGGSITSTIRLGNTTGSVNAAVDLIAPSGGAVLNRTINPRAGSTANTLSLNSLNSSGVNTYSGHVGLDHDFLVAQVAGGQLDITQLRATPIDTLTGFDIKGFATSFFVDGGGTINVTGTIYNSVNSGNVIKNGGGVMLLATDNTYTGATTVNEGTLQIGVGTTSGAIAAASNINSTGVGGTLAFNRSDSTTFANTVGGNVSLAQTGSGTTILTGANTSTGATIVAAGTLQVGAGTTSGSLGSGAITDNAALAFNRSDTVALNNPINGTGMLIHAGSGTVVMTGVHGYSGATVVDSATLQLGSGATAAALGSATIRNSGQLVVDSSAATTIAAVVEGSGNVRQVGAGTTTLTGANGYTGTTLITAGTVEVGNGGTSGSLGIGTVMNNAALAVNRSDAITIANVIEGTGAVYHNGSGTTTLSGNNTYSGGTTVNAGLLIAASPTAFGSGTMSTVVGNAALLPGLATAMKLAAIDIGGATHLDVDDNDVVIESGTNRSQVEAYIVSARNGGAWDGGGITSSAARVHPNGATMLGVLSGAEYDSAGGGGVFSGVPYTPTDTLVKYTWCGDADFNGEVNFDDYVRIDGGYNFALNGWINGDFDLSGSVDFDDYVLIDLGFNSQNGTLRRAQAYLSGDDRSLSEMNDPALRMVVDHFNQFGVAYASRFLSAVPEPTCTALAGGVTLVTLLRRRRRASLGVTGFRSRRRDH